MATDPPIDHISKEMADKDKGIRDLIQAIIASESFLGKTSELYFCQQVARQVGDLAQPVCRQGIAHGFAEGSSNTSHALKIG